MDKNSMFQPIPTVENAATPGHTRAGSRTDRKETATSHFRRNRTRIYTFYLWNGERMGHRAFHVGNMYMVDNVALLICYYDGKPGSTSYTMEYVVQKGLKIINIADR